MTALRPRTKPGPLSLNTATVREQWSLKDCIEGCARHGITGISPWRDKLAEYGTANAARHIREVGLTVTGRSAEHTSELQSLMRTSYAVLCLKKTNYTTVLTSPQLPY